jgi:predicted transcriptional regulator
MADITVTPANVHPYSGATRSMVQAGEAITPGQAVYLKSSDSKYYKADADAGISEGAAAGIAIGYAPAGDDYFLMQTAGDIDLGATLTVGEIYVVSGTAGGIAPCGDLAADDFTCILGIATAANKLALDIQQGNVAHG